VVAGIRDKSVGDSDLKDALCRDSHTCTCSQINKTVRRLLQHTSLGVVRSYSIKA
jgi:hypothetical protein